MSNSDRERTDQGKIGKKIRIWVDLDPDPQHFLPHFNFAGDAHAAFNFAATLECPIIFFW